MLGEDSAATPSISTPAESECSQLMMKDNPDTMDLTESASMFMDKLQTPATKALFTPDGMMVLAGGTGSINLLRVQDGALIASFATQGAQASRLCSHHPMVHARRPSQSGVRTSSHCRTSRPSTTFDTVPTSQRVPRSGLVEGYVSRVPMGSCTAARAVSAPSMPLTVSVSTAFWFTVTLRPSGIRTPESDCSSSQASPTP